nr:DUF5134 domain-containing protein [Mycobacterium avium]
MIHDLMLRWVVTGLFALTAAECGLAIVRKRRPWTSLLNHGLHFVVAVAMAAMAWPLSTQLPTMGPAVFFLLVAVWFAMMAVVVPTPGRALGPRMQGNKSLMAVGSMSAASEFLPLAAGTDCAGFDRNQHGISTQITAGREWIADERPSRIPWAIWPRTAGLRPGGDWQSQLRLLNGFGSALAAGAGPTPAPRAIATLRRTFVITWGDCTYRLQLGCRHRCSRWIYSSKIQLLSWARQYPGRVRIAMLCLQ